MAKIQNIFQNDFYERPIMPKWAWKISILGNPIEEWTEEQLSIFSKAVTKVDIPELSMLTVTSQFKGLTFDIPSRLENNGEISLTFNENDGLDLYKALKDMLYYTTYNDGYVIDEWSKQDDKGNYIDTYMLYYAPFDVWVRLYDPSNMKAEPTYNFIFRNCFVSNVSDVEMTYDSDEAYVYDVKIHYNFRIEGVDADEYIKHVEAAKPAVEDTIPEPPKIPEPEENVTEDVATEAPIPEPKTEGVDSTTSTNDTTQSTAEQPKVEGVDSTTETPTNNTSAEQPKAEGVEATTETPQQRAARQAAEAMSGYRPNSTGGVDTGTEQDADRSYSPGNSTDGVDSTTTEPRVSDNIVAKENSFENTVGYTNNKKELPEDNNESNFVFDDVKIKVTTADKWRNDINQDDMDSFANEPAEISPENKAALAELDALDLDDDEAKTKSKEVTDRWREEINQDDIDEIGNTTLEAPKKSDEVTDKWREEINQEDIDEIANTPTEPPSKSDIVTDTWKTESNEDYLRQAGKEKGEIPPDNQAALAELNNLDLDDREYMKKSGADRTKEEWQSYNDTMSKVGQKMSEQHKKDEEEKIIRMERGNFKSKAERTKIENDYKAQGYTVVWY